MHQQCMQESEMELLRRTRNTEAGEIETQEIANRWVRLNVEVVVGYCGKLG